MPVTKSILRYPGGKTQLTKFVNHTISLNKIKSPIYCEPFSGGAGVSLDLLLKNNVKKIILNDLDPAIYSIWYATINDTNRFIDTISNMNIDIKEWYKQKQIYTELRDIKQYDFNLAVATLFLNRTNRGGIITAGPIGGYAQNSKYKLDCRFNPSKIIEKIKLIASQHHRIELYMLDAKELIKKVLLNYDKKQLFTFFDPPYYHQGQALYKNSFTHDDHEELSNVIKLMNDFYWITTYDKCPEIKSIYSNYPVYTYKLKYSINVVRNANEYIFSSPVTLLRSFDKVQLFSDSETKI